MNETPPRPAPLGLGAAGSPSEERGEETVIDRAVLRFLPWLPHLGREDRKDLAERLEAGATWRPDFVVMMALSSALAALGLLQGSTAVVIGAMLVAPLMNPLLAAGLALVQGNVRLFRSASQALAIGIAVGLAISLALSVLAPGYEPSLEIEARGNPDLLDLVIAFCSGLAAAWASARPNVASSLAGVAIAAALVPPLAVVALGLGFGRPVISGLAAVLFLTNLSAIVLGAALVFRLLGVHGARGGDAAPLWARRTTLTLIVSAALLAAPLMISLIAKRREGERRPVAYPVSTQVRRAVEEFLADWPGVELMLLGRSSTEPNTEITILVSTEDYLPESFRTELVGRVHRTRGDHATVNVLPLRTGWRWEARETAEEGPPDPGRAVDVAPPLDRPGS